MISAGAAVPERELRLDVFGKLKAAEIDAKVIEVATAKQQRASCDCDSPLHC